MSSVGGSTGREAIFRPTSVERTKSKEEIKCNIVERHKSGDSEPF